MNLSLENKVALVTGGSRGIGRAIALGLAKSGADVIVTSRKIADLENVAEEIKVLGRKSLAVATHIGRLEEIKNLVEKAKAQFGRIDILVNNAGIIRRAPLTEFSEKDWYDVINLNQNTVFFLSQMVAKLMIARGEGGKIINIASLLSFQGGILVPSYTASKSAVMGLTRAMANELAPHHINVNAIAPGYMATDNTAPLRANPARAESILERIPIGRWGEPADLQGVAVFLASSASDYMTGYTVAVDGGWLAR